MYFDANELNAKLAARCLELCKYLLPNGKKSGNEWCVGSVNGEEGSSLKIVLDGPKAGCWKDFAGSNEDRGRKLIGLWAAVRKVPWRKALEESAKWLGEPGHGPVPYTLIRQDYQPLDKNELISKLIKLEKAPQTLNHLTKERSLALHALQAYKVCALADDSGYCFPTFEEDALVGCKYKLLKRDERGKKVIWQEQGSKPVLWGMQAIPPDSDYIILTEGEEDALSYASEGLPAVSIPGGAQNHKWIDLCWDWVHTFQRIYISFDQDKEGLKATQIVLERLGREKCFVINLPKGFKDANEYRHNEGAEHPQLLQPLVELASTLEPEELTKAENFREDTWAVLSKPQTGLCFDFTSTWEYRPGELTLLTGEPGSGKSQWTLQVTLELLLREKTCLIASLEIPTRKYLAKLTKMTNGGWVYAEEANNRILFETAFKTIASLLVYDRGKSVGSANSKELLSAINYARKRFGLEWFVIDSLMMLSIGTDDYKAQEDFAEELAILCTNTGLSGILVAHPRKDGNNQKQPERIFTLSDIKGASTLVAVPHNVLVLQRSRTAEEKINEALETEDYELLKDYIKEPTSIIRILKDREQGRLGFSRLYFDQKSEQFNHEYLKYKTYLNGHIHSHYRDQDDYVDYLIKRARKAKEYHHQNHL